MKDYPETHQQGLITIEQDLKTGALKGDLGIQIAKDGRVWICINGIATIRFKPLTLDRETSSFSKTKAALKQFINKRKEN